MNKNILGPAITEIIGKKGGDSNKSEEKKVEDNLEPGDGTEIIQKLISNDSK